MKALLLIAALLCAAPVVSSAATFGDNLVVNGDAESSTGGTGDPIGPVAGFTTTGEFTVVAYAAGGGYPTAVDPGPVDRGLNFFSGGSDANESTGMQAIDVSAGSSAIDGGSSTFDLSAWLGGFASQEDHTTLTLSFLDSGGAVLGSGVTLGPVSADDRGNLTGLLFRETTGFVPVGTRTIDLTLDMLKFTGSADDGYADNVSLVLNAGAVSAVPETSSFALCLAGFGLIGWSARRRQCLPSSPSSVRNAAE
jgi:hypothetical protein